jgi:hypothetical protein
MSGFITVEFAALVVPRWRRMRFQSVGRTKLDRSSLVLSVVLALCQSFGVAMWLEGLEAEATAATADAYTGSRIATITVLTFGAAFYAYLATSITRFGVGNGIAILLVFDSILQLRVSGPSGSPDLAALAPSLGVAGLVAIVAGLVVLEYDKVGTAVTDGDRRTLLPKHLRIPSCSMFPVTASTGAAALVESLRAFPSVAPYLPEQPVGPGIQLFITGVLGMTFAFAFNRPDAVADVVERLRPSAQPDMEALRREVLGAALRSTLFVLVIASIALWMSLPFDLVLAINVTAVAMDIWGEWNFRRLHGDAIPLARLHRVFTVDPAIAALRDAGIPAFARGIHQRTLLHFFGPYVPAEIFVPAADRARAAKILRVLDESEPRADRESEAESTDPVRDSNDSSEAQA